MNIPKSGLIFGIPPGTGLASTRRMVYFFERDRDRARTVVETRRDEGRFEIALHHPDGTTTVHAAETAQHFLARLEEVSAWLREARWRHRPIDPLLTSVARLDSTDLMR